MKKQCLMEILELTKLQTTALENEEIDNFEELMQKKQTYMDQIDKGKFGELDNEEREIVLKITEIDNTNRKEFDKQLEKTKQQLCKIRTLKKRDNVYTNTYNTAWEEGMFIDKK